MIKHVGMGVEPEEDSRLDSEIKKENKMLKKTVADLQAQVAELTAKLTPSAAADTEVAAQ